jgi:MFS family permease
MPSRLQRNLARQVSPVKRLLYLSFIIDVGAACVILGSQFRAIELQAPPLLLGLLGTATFLVSVAMNVVGGHLSDRLGRRMVTLLSCGVCIVGWFGLLTVQTIWQLLALSTLSGIGLGLLWPPVEAWLADLCGDNPRLLKRNIGLFNMAWTLGLVVGPLVAGPAWEAWGERLFLLPGALAIVSLILTLLTPPAPHSEHSVPPPDHVHPESVRVFMFMAWCGVFAGAFARGLLNAMFPRVGVDLGYSHTLIGRLIFVLAAAMFVSFTITRISSRWQYRLPLLIASVFLSIFAMLLGAVADNPWWFALSFAVAGGALGLTYVSGITYVLHAGAEGRGKRLGVHEAMMGSGLIFGPLCGGLAGQYLNLRAPFLVAAGVFALALVGQIILWLGRPRNHSARLSTAATPPSGSS